MRLGIFSFVFICFFLAHQSYSMEPRGFSTSLQNSLQAPKAWDPGPLLGQLGGLNNQTQEICTRQTSCDLVQIYSSAEISRETTKKDWLKKLFTKITKKLLQYPNTPTNYKIKMGFENNYEQREWEELFTQTYEQFKIESTVNLKLEREIIEQDLVFIIQANKN